MAESQIALVKKDTVDVVAAKIKEFQSAGEIKFPPNYSPENALKSSWLILQQTVNRDKKPVLEACTKNSIANALLDLVVQGLNPSKKQAYFIAYGNQLTMQRSYFGTMAVTKMVSDVDEIVPEVVYKGDVFEFEIVRGKKRVTKHTSSLESMSGEIVAAYCTLFVKGEEVYTDIMTMADIKKSWAMSKNNPDSPTSTHSKFPVEMAKKTIVNRACKAYLNSSDDSSLVMQHFNHSDDAIEEAEMADEIAQNANGEIIDVEFEDAPVDDTAPPAEPAQGGLGLDDDSAGPGF